MPIRPKSSNNNFDTSPISYFQNLNAKVFSDAIDNFMGVVTGYPEDSNMPGAIQFRIPGISNKSDAELVAQPENPNFYIKPVPGTFVRIKWFQGYYVYSGLYKHNSIENNDFLLEELSESVLRLSDIPNYTSGANDSYDKLEYIDIGKEIPLIKEKSGDLILRGNNNNDIILSYKEDGSPHISILVNRENSEYNVNDYGIHIFGNFDVDNEIDFNNNSNKYKPSDEENDSSLVINFDKIRLMSRLHSIYISSANEYGVSSKSDITMFSEKSFNVDSPSINLGENADESLVLGNKLSDWLGQLIDALSQLTVGTPVGPSTIPVNVAVFKKLKAQLNSILSKQNNTV